MRMLRLLSVVLAVTLAASTHGAEAKRPNVILIMADDVGYECFGCYGSKEYKTPVLDKLADTGARFTHCYSQPLCTPSRVKIMTGRRNIYNYYTFGLLHPKEKTFGHMMQAAGYKTCVVGKWQLFGSNKSGAMAGKGMAPSAAGFDEYCLWQVKTKHSRFWGPGLYINGETKMFPEETYGPDVLVDYASRFIDQNKDKPFFLYYPMVLVHSPFVPTPDSVDRKNKDKKQNFVDMVQYMDKCIGRLVSQLEKSGVRENTLIMFTGDNGTHKSLSSMLNGMKIQGGKGKMTDAGTREPLIASWPGTIAKGTVCDDLVEFSDFFTTIADATGTALPTDRKLDGVSFLPQLKGQKGNPRQWIYCYNNPRAKEHTPDLYFVRNKRWKLYGNGNLYDIQSDVLEKTPVQAGVDEADAARKMLQAALDSMPKEPQLLHGKGK